MVIPVGPQGGSQWLEQYDKKEDGTIVKEKLMGVIYVPLTDKSKQLPSKFCNILYIRSVVVWITTLPVLPIGFK